MEEAGHYANEENLYVSATKRANGEPATDEDANGCKGGRCNRLLCAVDGPAHFPEDGLSVWSCRLPFASP